MTEGIQTVIRNIIKVQHDDKDPLFDLKGHFSYETISMVGIPLDLEEKVNHSAVFKLQTFSDNDLTDDKINDVYTLSDWHPLTFKTNELKAYLDETSVNDDRFFFMIEHCRRMVRSLYDY